MNPKSAGLVKPLLGLAFALALAAFLPLSGCNGGTSTGADNPDLILQVRDGDKVVEFNGFIQFFVQNSNPEFFTLPPDDGNLAPRVEIQDSPGATIILKGESTFNVPRDMLARLINAHPSLALRKTAAGIAPEIPDFNVVLIGFDSSAGLLAGIHSDTSSGAFTGLEMVDNTLIIRISHDRSYSGTVDNSTPAGRALALFVPGTAFFAQVDGDNFRFEGVPEGKFPLRWVSANGRVHEMKDSLGATWTHPLQPGAQIDSIRIPPAIPTLAPPAAAPPGQYAFTDSASIVLTAQPGAAIYYSLDGKAPDRNSPRYTGPILLRSSATIMAVAYLTGWNRSPVSVNNYVLVPDLPVATPESEGFRDSLVVVLSSKSKDARIYYTLDGSTPTSNSTLYAQPIVLTVTTALKAMTVTGLGESRILQEMYILVPDSIPSPP
ncbi:MAG: hypothetical protein JWO30_659 [Fibrobacteres bacterium]|nr:hypothetical protein [Fibrobacterota bacterium]